MHTPKAAPKFLENTARSQLQRFGSSSENLRLVLGRRIKRSARAQGTDRTEGQEAIEDIIIRFERAGLLAGAYASAPAASHYRSGASARAIRAKLNEKGVPPGAIDAATEVLAYTGANPEFAAAAAYVRRRWLGLYRPEGEWRILTPWRGPDSGMSFRSASSMRRSPMSWSSRRLGNPGAG